MGWKGASVCIRVGRADYIREQIRIERTAHNHLVTGTVLNICLWAPLINLVCCVGSDDGRRQYISSGHQRTWDLGEGLGKFVEGQALPWTGAINASRDAPYEGYRGSGNFMCNGKLIEQHPNLRLLKGGELDFLRPACSYSKVRTGQRR